MNAMMSTNDTPVTMTSLELVEFINDQRGEGESELRHDHFMAKVPKVLGEKAAPKFSGTAFYVNGTGAKVERAIYHLPKREACLMAMSYSYDLQAKVFDRMTELEARPMDPMRVLSDPAAMRGLLLTYTEKVIALEEEKLLLVSENTELKPKAEALDLISAGTDTLTFTQGSKVLGIKRNALTARMHAERWIYRQNGSWVAYDQHIQNGNLVYKEATYTDEKTGLTCRKPYCHITPKGLVKLAQMFAVELEKEAA